MRKKSMRLAKRSAVQMEFGTIRAGELQVRDGIHLATPAECAAQAPGTPWPCWAGGSQSGYLTWQATHGYVGGGVLTMYGPQQYIVFDGIDFDARGIAMSLLSISCNKLCGNVVAQTTGQWDGPRHIKFQNLEIRNSISSCLAQPGAGDDIETDLIFVNVKIYNCGVPYDTHYYNNDPAQGLARKHKEAKYYHPWYMHAGGNTLINSETYNAAGTGLGVVGSNNYIVGNYIHDNSSHGLQTAGTNAAGAKPSTYCNNVIYNNGGFGIEMYGWNDVICNNTVVAGPLTIAGTFSWGGTGMYLHVYARNNTIENNIVYGYGYAGITNGNTTATANIFRNNLVYGSTYLSTNDANGPLTLQNNIMGQDPLFANRSGLDFSLQAKSPAINAGYQNGLRTDHTGATRDLRPDIGAFEYRATDIVPPDAPTGLSISVSGG